HPPHLRRSLRPGIRRLAPSHPRGQRSGCCTHDRADPALDGGGITVIGRAVHRLLRRTAGPLRDELAISWRAWLIVVVVLALGLTAAIPALSLRRPDLAGNTALALDPVPPLGPVAAWTAEVAGPSVSRAAALAELFAVLVA